MLGAVLTRATSGHLRRGRSKRGSPSQVFQVLDTDGDGFIDLWYRLCGIQSKLVTCFRFDIHKCLSCRWLRFAKVGRH